MINNENVRSRLEFIKNFYKEAFEQPGRIKSPEIDIRFYPYIGLHHTIRLRDGKAYVRVAELMADAPLAVQRALAFILVAKLMRRKVSKAADQMYRDYTSQEHIRDKAEESRKTRGRKIIGSSKGRFYDLDRIFTQLNAHYFQNELPKPVLTWSQRKTHSILGHHDPTHETVVISKSLDSAKVPAFVVEYILYHELLHIKHPIEMINGRQRKHSRAFKQDEKKFPYYEQAERWLKFNL
jgi:predicted metal-dependent hydrolase